MRTECKELRKETWAQSKCRMFVNERWALVPDCVWGTCAHIRGDDLHRYVATGPPCSCEQHMGSLGATESNAQEPGVWQVYVHMQPLPLLSVWPGEATVTSLSFVGVLGDWWCLPPGLLEGAVRGCVESSALVRTLDHLLTQQTVAEHAPQAAGREGVPGEGGAG